MDKALRQRVWERSGGVCEYCRMPWEFNELPFQIDHIVAEQHGGPTRFGNLATACTACNKFKGSNLSGIDEVTRKVVRLFNPRRQRWQRHFQWQGPLLQGRTAIGRATVNVLQFNLDYRVALRELLIREGVFPLH